MVGAQQPERVGDVIARLFSRGSLPERIVVRRATSPLLRPGSLWRWDESARAYVSSIYPGCVLPFVVRRGWGVFFEPAPVEECQLCLL
jgi:hypothetical protein